ncbi:hypothetical protein HIM_01053 [Hirsutella minnesotensis 3608]|nr:hypothetical protein HIM_01053 [Hirsutella minnesotensis 3608]
MAVKKEHSPPADAVDIKKSTKRKSVTEEEIEVDLSAPEPPSKRARRALKKGKTITKKASSDDEDAGSDSEKKDGKDKARSEHAIWVGNLPFNATAAELRQWLVDNSGESIAGDAITRIKLPTIKEPGRDKTQPPTNKGFAYVDFSDLAPKVAAIALSETDFRGRKLLIKDAKSFEGRPKKEEEPVPAAEGAADAEKDVKASRKVFVGNMGFKTTQEDLTRQFEKCGEIEWVKVATFEDTGKCKGYGWVQFKEPEAAAWAVKGFVKIKEEVETEEDFDADAGADGEPKQKQFKTRKWWVNRLLGRQLKLELAEDDQTRYKKRFGKDAAAKREDGSRAPRDGAQRSRQAGTGRDRTDAGVAAAPKAPEPLKEATDIQVARLTGAVVKHTGTKVSFE